MNEIFKYVIFFIIAAGIIYSGWRLIDWLINKEVSQRTELIIPDTLVVEKIKTEWKTDTVIKWYETPFYNKSKSEVIYIQSDSSIKADLENKDLIISLKKEKNDLKIFAHNKNDSIVKEYSFTDVSRDFSATATARNIFVKSKTFYWNGLNLSTELSLSLNNLHGFTNLTAYEKNLSLSTGFNYKDKTSLDLGIKYVVPIKDYLLFAKFNYKILQ